MNDAEEIARLFNEIVDAVKETRAQNGSRDELTRSQVEFLRQIRKALCN